MPATPALAHRGTPRSAGRTRSRVRLAGVAVTAALAVALAACSGPETPSSGSTAPSGRAAGTATSGSTVTRATTPSTTAAPTATAPTTTTPLTAEQCAHTLLEAMSPAERAGQLLMVGLDTNARRNSLDDLLSARHLGGVILLGGWYGGADSVHTVTRHLDSLTADSGPGLFIAADQEGGNVQQLRGAGFTRMPTARVESRLSPNQLAARAAGWATELRRAGINVNLAPVADTVPADLGRANDPIGQWDRQFSSEPDEVGRSVGAFVEGMHRGGVAATVKHFPGIGRITGNTDLTDQGITDRTTSSTDRYLRPFASGIEAGADLVMVGSAVYSRIDPGVNAAFSTKIVTGLLREQLGYRGVVITDDVGAAKAVSATPVGQRATRFVDAGGDIVLTARPATVPTMHDALVSRMANSAPFAHKVEVAAERVITLKVKRGLASCG